MVTSIELEIDHLAVAELRQALAPQTPSPQALLHSACLLLGQRMAVALYHQPSQDPADMESG